MDDYSPDTIQTLMEYGHQYIEEMYDSEDNQMNSLIEKLLNE